MELCFDADPTYMAQGVQLTPADICLLKVNNRNTRTRCKICSKLTKTPERRQWRRSGDFIVNIEHFSHLVLVFLLLTLDMYVLVGGKSMDFRDVAEPCQT